MFLGKKNKESVKQTKPSANGKLNKALVRSRRNAQNAIIYEKMLRNGICVLPDNLYSGAVAFKDINYQIAPEEEQTNIFGKYMKLLNTMGQEHGLQLVVHNRKIDAEQFGKDMEMRYRGDGLDKFRKEFNRNISNSLSKGNNQIVSEKMFVFTVKEDSYEEAKRAIEEIEKDLKNEFTASLRCEADIMDGYSRLESIYTMLHPDSRFAFNYDMLDSSFTTKDAICPDLLDFKTLGTGAFKINDRYAKVLYMKNWATELKDDLIKEFSMLEHNLVVSFHMRIVPRGDDISMIKNQIAKMEMEKVEQQRKALKQGYDPEMLPMDLRYSLEEGELLLNDVEKRNQRLFETQMLIFINAASQDELNRVEKSVTNICKRQSCTVGTLHYRQEEGLNAVLPFGYPVRNLARTLPTSACSIIMPFTSQELMEGGNSIFYGRNKITGNVIRGDRRNLANASGWIFAQPGFGKSFFAKSELTQIILNSNDDVVVLDPQGEYVELAKQFHGSTIQVDTRSGVHFNPFDNVDVTDRNAIKEKADFAQTMCAEMLGGGSLDPEQKSIVDGCVRAMYNEYARNKQSSGVHVLPPSLDDFYRIMKTRPEDKAKTMALSMEMYTLGGTYDIFAGQNNVDLNKRLTVFNMMNLSDNLRPLAMKVILETLLAKVKRNFESRIYTWLYIDEIYRLLKDEYSETFLYEFYKNARKLGGIPTGINQNVEDQLRSATGRTMISNSTFWILLNQSASDAEELVDLLDLSDDQRECIMSGAIGTGLIRHGNTIIPFENKFPTNTELYKIWSTKFDEDI